MGITKLTPLLLENAWISCPLKILTEYFTPSLLCVNLRIICKLQLTISPLQASWKELRARCISKDSSLAPLAKLIALSRIRYSLNSGAGIAKLQLG